jgi:hypothetical protein
VLGFNIGGKEIGNGEVYLLWFKTELSTILDRLTYLNNFYENNRWVFLATPVGRCVADWCYPELAILTGGMAYRNIITNQEQL